MQTISIQTKQGAFTASFSERGLARLEFPSSRPAAAVEPAEEPLTSPTLRLWKKLTAQALQEALAGRAAGTLPPLDLSQGTEFQQRVWAALLQIPPGQTRTYAQVAETIQTPGASRAVGSACGANPVPIFVPCHRVVAANGGLGGFSAGLPWKQHLLTQEGGWDGPNDQ